MLKRPRIFISAVSKELASARQLAANTLTFLGFDPVWQDIFDTQPGDLRSMLRRRIDECEGVLQIVGNAYGAEPDLDQQSDISPDDMSLESRRLSYTQYEAAYARSINKQVWTFVVTEDYPTDDYEAETAELQGLQEKYRQSVKKHSDLVYTVSNKDALESTSLKLRNEFAKLRRSFDRWMKFVAVAVCLLLLLSAVAIVVLNSNSQVVREAAEQNRNAAKSSQDASSRIVESSTAVVEAANETKAVVGSTDKSVRRLDSREAINAAIDRVERARVSRNLSHQGQVAALELLLENGYEYSSSVFDGVNLTGGSFLAGNFESSSFMDANLSSCNFTNANLIDTTCYFAKADNLVAKEVAGKNFRMQFALGENANFSESNLERSAFTFSKLRKAKFVGCNLRFANLSFADLTDADFTGADLTGAQFVNSILDDAVFDKAVFSETDVSGATAQSIKLTDKQRSGLCRTTGWSTYIRIEGSVRFPSSKYDSGYSYDDTFRMEFNGICAPASGTLSLKKKELPEPIGHMSQWWYRGEWHAPDPRLFVRFERDFFDVHGRRSRIEKRIKSQCEFLVTHNSDRTPVEGDGGEFRAWFEELEKRSENVTFKQPIPLTSANRFVLSLRDTANPIQDVPFHTWQKYSRRRYELEKMILGEIDVDEVNNRTGSRFLKLDSERRFVDGWPLIYPENKNHDFAELPREHATLFRDWTIKRAGQMVETNIQFMLSPPTPSVIKELKSTGAPWFPFEHLLVENDVSNGSDLFNESSKSSKIYSIRDSDVFAHMSDRSAAKSAKDQLTLDSRSKIWCTAKLLNFRRVKVPRSSDFRDHVRIDPIEVHVIDDNGKIHSTSLEHKSDLP